MHYCTKDHQKNTSFFGCCNQGLVKCLGCNIKVTSIFFIDISLVWRLQSLSSLSAVTGPGCFFLQRRTVVVFTVKNPHHIEVLQNLPVSPAASQWHWKLAPGTGAKREKTEKLRRFFERKDPSCISCPYFKYLLHFLVVLCCLSMWLFCVFCFVACNWLEFFGHPLGSKIFNNQHPVVVIRYNKSHMLSTNAFDSPVQESILPGILTIHG